MKYGRIKGLDIEVSRLVCGCAGDLMQAGGDNSELLDASFEAGINFFDTARCYGDSEISLGRWIKDRGNRHNIAVLSKGCHPKKESLSVHRVTAEDIRSDLDTSLGLLGTDYIDVYLLHRDDVRVPVCELLEALDEERRKGKILTYGVSNWTLERFMEAQEYASAHGLAGFAVNSPNYSLAEQVGDPWESGSEAISIGGEQGRQAREYYTEQNIPIVAYSSLARGLFSGKFSSSDADRAGTAMDSFALRGFYSEDNIEKLRRVEVLAEEKSATVSQIALAYLLAQKIAVYPIVSFSKKKHLEDNVGAFEVKLSEEELRFLDTGKKE